MKNMKKFVAALMSTLLLSSCVPSGNAVGKAEFTTIDSNFLTPTGVLNVGDLVIVDVNGGIVATPKGLRLRLNKMTFTTPTRGLFLYVNKYNDVISGPIPKDIFTSSKVKGRNFCASLAGTFNNGVNFVAAIYGNPKDSSQLLAIYSLDDAGYFIGQTTAGNIQIGGRNLCSGEG